jgi:hypothetical protein
MYSIGLTFEYSRMKVPSLSRGCEIAPFFVRYMVNRTWHEKAENKTSITTKAMMWSFECTIVDSNKGALISMAFHAAIMRTLLPNSLLSLLSTIPSTFSCAFSRFDSIVESILSESNVIGYVFVGVLVGMM